MTTAGHRGPLHPSLRVRGGLAVVLAVIANLLVVLGIESLGVAPGFRALTLPPVAVLSALGAGGATVVYWLVRRRATAPDRTFLRIAIAALLLSFVPDLALLAVDPATTPVAVAVLMAMHVVVALVAVWLLVAWRADR
jgi:hypothetical protein